MTKDEMTGGYRVYEAVAHTGVATGTGHIVGAMTGNPAVGKAAEVAVGTVLHHFPTEVKAGTALGAGLGGVSALHAVVAVGGVALAPAVAVVAMGAAAVGAVVGGAALIGKAVGVFDK